MTTQTDMKDFDAAWQEQAANAPTFKALGEVFTLPKSPPVKLTLTALRAAQGGDPSAKVAPDRVVDLAGLLIGRDATQRLLDNGVTFDQLGDVVRFAQEAYTAKRATQPGPPVAGTTESAGPSSPTGDTSKPTSSVSTDWIS